MTTSAFSVPIDDRYFEDYIVGASYEFGPIEAEEREMISFAKRFDPQTMHVDPVKAKDGRYGGLIASGGFGGRRNAFHSMTLGTR